MSSLITRYRNLSIPLRLIVINVAILLIIHIVAFTTSITGTRLDLATMFLDLPSGLGFLLRPWAAITYMFTHTDIMHCLFNMLWLYWFGRLCEDLSTPRHTVILYLTGGIGGALAFIIASMLWPYNIGGFLEGASAAVMAIVASVACTSPDMKLNLLFLGSVKIKWIALATVVIFALGLTGSNAGAHVAHLGGIAVGVSAALIKRARRPRYNHMSTKQLNDLDARAELDRLLDKVRRSGYNSLTVMERKRLIDLSHKV